MGATAARQAGQILSHVETIVAIELLAAAQGVDFRRKRRGHSHLSLGRGTKPAFELVRQNVPFVAHDELLAPHIESIRQLVAQGTIKKVVEAAVEAGD